MWAQNTLEPNVKYPWQQAVVDAARELQRERLPEKIAAAERAISARLAQIPEDPDEQLALRGARCAIEILQYMIP